MTRLKNTMIFWTMVSLLPFLGLPQAEARHGDFDYTQLFAYIAMRDLESPLVAFGDDEKEFDRQLNQENIAFLNTNKPLLTRIQSQLPGDRLQWKLNNAYKKLLLVPEKRPAYATLFEQYCREAVDFLLDQIDMPDPYGRITTFNGTDAFPANADTDGITVYLVHNIANEYIEEYQFYNPDDGHAGIQIQLSNLGFSGILGSYTSRLKIGRSPQLKFVRDTYTIWQNSAETPLNVFIVPIEETLHILLRPSTETAMIRQIKSLYPGKTQPIEDIVDGWMAVEEALVGGLVRKIMPALLVRLINDAAEPELDAAMAARDTCSQYRYLDQGVRLVADLGMAAAIAQYQESPERFREHLQQIQTPVTAALKCAEAPRGQLNLKN